MPIQFPLILDTNESAFIVALDGALEQAFLDGVLVPTATPPALPALQGYDKLTTEQRQQTKDVFKTVFAALISKFDAPTIIQVTSFSNDYQGFADPQIAGGGLRLYKDVMGTVHLYGQVRTPAAPAADQVVTTLPAGYRPGAGDGHVFPAVVDTGAGSVSVLPNGQVICRGTPTSGVALSIDIRFRAGA